MLPRTEAELLRIPGEGLPRRKTGKFGHVLLSREREGQLFSHPSPANPNITGGRDSRFSQQAKLPEELASRQPEFFHRPRPDKRFRLIPCDVSPDQEVAKGQVGAVRDSLGDDLLRGGRIVRFSMVMPDVLPTTADPFDL